MCFPKTRLIASAHLGHGDNSSRVTDSDSRLLFELLDGQETQSPRCGRPHENNLEGVETDTEFSALDVLTLFRN
jgi:hypothetical protein